MPQKNMENRKSSTKPRISTHNLVLLSLLSAIGIILSSLEFSIFPAASYLKFDPGSIPVLIGAMLFGPMAGFAMSVIISFVQSFFIHGSGGIYGFVMHVLASVTLTVVVGILYNRKKPSMQNMMVSFVAGSLAMIAVMVGANMIVTPLFVEGFTMSDVAKTIVPIVIPFNALKASINCVATAALYKALEKTRIFERMA